MSDMQGTEPAGEVRQAPVEVERIAPAALALFKAEMRERGVELADYELFFYEQPDAWIVSAGYRFKPPGWRGSVSGHPDYDVTIGKQDLRVRSVFLAR